jgi:hypothetical protein
MTNTNLYASAAGILAIVSGVIGILIGLSVAGMGLFFFFIFNMTGDVSEGPPPPDFFPWIFVGIYGVMGFLVALMGVLAIIGGAYSIKKKYWGLALAGAIAGSAVFFYTGIASVVMVSLAKSEFETLKPAIAGGEPTLEAALKNAP